MKFILVFWTDTYFINGYIQFWVYMSHNLIFTDMQLEDMENGNHNRGMEIESNWRTSYA